MYGALRHHLRRPIVWSRKQRPLHWARTRLDHRAAVLMYHGVGDVDIDPWGLFVSPDNFAEHLDVLRSSTVPLSLRALACRCADGSVEHRSIAVTFDDGYANNLTTAKPLLEAHDVPATIFIVTSAVERSGEYWWDRLAAVLLRPGRLPSRIALPVDAQMSEPATFELGDAVEYSESEWRADHAYRDGESVPSPRMALYHRVWEHLLHLPDDVRHDVLDTMAVWAGSAPEVRETHRCVTADELIRLDGGDVVEVGAHTITHPLLPQVTPEVRRTEIVEGKRRLEAMVDRPIDSFSYPFGGHDHATVAAVADAGFDVAVTTRPETTTVRVEPLRIPRFDVKNWDGEQFERRLTNWLRFR